MEEFRKALRELAGLAGLPLSAEQTEKLTLYYVMLEEANRSFNLTTVVSPGEAAERHFIDSLALPALNLLSPGERIIDVGSGAGFPGLPIAIVRDSLTVVLLDSTRKRTAFLESVVHALGLSNVSVVTARAEDYARGPARETFDAALSRAVAPLNVLLEYTLPLIRPGGKALAWKGPQAGEEMAAAARASALLGGGEMKSYGYSLSGRSGFYIIEVKKIRQTPGKYPRKAGKPSSEPII